MFRIPLAAILATGLALPAAAEITVEDAYARASTPVAGAAFLVIRNPGGPDDRLVGARSAAAERVELHTHLEEDGVMQMLHVEEGLPLPADGTIEMRRGAEHVMLMGLKVPFEDGETVPLTLVFESGAEVELDVVVDNQRMDMTDHSN